MAQRLPEPLAPLARLAYNYRWCWLPGGEQPFHDVDPHRWRVCGGNPVRFLQEVSPQVLSSAAADTALCERAAAVEERVRASLDSPPAVGPIEPDHPVAFFCTEYAIHGSLPVYSGGLGVLAGDFLKEASDMGVPFVAVGLMYREGYFRQRIDLSGWQHEYWVDTDPERLPAVLVSGSDGQPLTISLPIRGREVCAQIWRVDVGRVPLYLLDAERPENDHLSRWISSRLYVGDEDTRLAQYAMLGAGGVRALAALGIEPAVVHLNEGHAAMAPLELARLERDNGASAEAAFEAARRRTIFTTHTPVPAGNDTYPGGQAIEALGALAEGAGLGEAAFLKMGRTHPNERAEPFGVSQFALRSSRAANGVSRRHGEVARQMWQPLWPELAANDVPIGHVTNGVHIPTWLGDPMRRLLDRHLGPDWTSRASHPATWAHLDEVHDKELWTARQEQRAALVEFVRERSVADRLSRGEPYDYVERAAHSFDPDVLTVGFARRLATYKRLHLLLQDLQRSLALMAGDPPLQILLAGKAHPRDDAGKAIVQKLFSVKGAPFIGERVVYLQDYDLPMAKLLVQGCDVWVNLPRPPLEASGTSGMKSVVNGGLQLSVLDGWWGEAYDADVGWALSGEVDTDEASQDARDAAEMYRVLEDEVVPSFYERDDAGLPRAWLARVRASLRKLAPAFSASRMLEDYVERMYRNGSG